MEMRGCRKLCKERVEWKKITEKAKNPQWVCNVSKRRRRIENIVQISAVAFVI